ncbi:probable protein phosphatase 2C 21 [Coccinella septempunctata]|uniref:probable protein phosphatase 2C 21 n=1 Tax=Coccinella septempunctata TaxID=41139 RepID=UPI001D081E9B|nr:probable protein phosphatase 2C 21 [Coccinella septempunctata]
MGSYASEPKVDKESLDEYNDRLNCGASSMQGWRVSQEDAHNCLLDFDTNCSFFAVYDGHGGHEVAQYCSQKLPDHIKKTEAYKEGNIEKALIEGFLSFDQTITTADVIKELKAIAETEEDVEDEDDEEDVAHLYEEATMPIEQVIEKYTSNALNPVVKSLKKNEKPPKSPCLKGKKINDGGEGTSSMKPDESPSSEEAGPSHSTDEINSAENHTEILGDEAKSEDKPAEDDSKIPKIEITTPQNTESNGTQSEEEATKNGEILNDKSESSDIQENGETTPKGKGKAKMKRITPVQVRSSPRIKLSPNSLYKKLLVFDNDDEEETEDEDDTTFDGGQENSSEDEENSQLEEEEEDSEDSSNDEEDCLDDEEMLEFTRNMKDEPGSDSGCTAVVAILKEKKLWVANAGDSRCVVCRNGKAIEMSFDHKPEDEPERERIYKAGGRVTMDGRVNNGLNLSRAIGDHAYKQNAELGPEEQMITALPDIKNLDIEEDDEFIILACDGIWNFMSSQEVVDFIRPKIKENRQKLSSIIEELFDHCLAPNTMGDGTGCDNMTAIIVQFRNNRKRSASPECQETESVKRVKTDNSVEPTV